MSTEEYKLFMATEEYKSALADASALLSSEYTMEDVYALLGAELEIIEALNKPTELNMWMGISEEPSTMKIDWTDRARAFLEKFWSKIVANVCKWWKDNRDKTSTQIIASITPLVAAVIPPPWGWIAGIIAIVASILVKSGFDAACGTGPTKQPL